MLIVLTAGLLELILFAVWKDTVVMLKGDAHVINMVGSERMRLLRMALLAEHYTEGGRDIRVKIMLDNEINIFEDILHGLKDGNPRYNLKKTGEPEVAAGLEQNIDTWQRNIKPLLQNILLAQADKEFSALLNDYRGKVFEYSAEIDKLAALYAGRSEKKVEKLQRMQFIFLFLTGLVALGSLVYVYIFIIRPIRNIVRVSKSIADGNLSARMTKPDVYELKELAVAFNAMTERLVDTIGDLRRKTDELGREKIFSEGVIDSLPLNIYIVDRNYKIVAWNRKREYGPFGISREDAVGKKLWDIFDENFFKSPFSKDRAEMESEFAEVFQTGKPVEKEEVSTTFGERRFFRIIKIPLMTREDDVSHVITAIEDITEKRVMESQLFAVERLSAVGEVAAGVAHEINNPLASMAVCVESLRKDTLPDNFTKEENYSKFDRYLRIVESEIYRAKNITQSLLDSSRERDPIIKDVNVNEVLVEILNLLQIQHKYRGFIVKKHCDDTLPHIDGDEGQLRQVFLAIIVNAFEAMEPGGILKVSTVRDIENGSGVVKIRFEDNGHGIPQENLNKIFQAFFTTKGNAGTGLGLSICYGIVRQHGGRIEVKSEVGKGSVFTVTLPTTTPLKVLGKLNGYDANVKD
jgi:two-component system NtrC family sensor kinase